MPTNTKTEHSTTQLNKTRNNTSMLHASAIALLKLNGKYLTDKLSLFIKVLIKNFIAAISKLLSV